MLRAVRRTKLPIWYTEGFNRHPFMTFSLPLSLGIRSLRDSFDIRLENSVEIDEQAQIEKLNEYLPSGIEIISITEPIMKPKDISFASFQMLFADDNLSGNDLQKKLSKFLAQENIFVLKKSKSGEKRVDLKEYFNKYEIEMPDSNSVQVNLLLPAGNNININPFLITNAFNDYIGKDIFSDVTRENLFNQDMEAFI